MRILVIGGGGREHALVWKLSQSPKVSEIFCAPGNPGISTFARCVDIEVSDNEGLAQFAVKQGIDLTVVGPEAPLVNGITDLFTAKGLKVFGPSQAAARLEGSKAFAKNLMQKYNIPTASYAVFTDTAPAKEYIERIGAPVVVKADGLAAGKGVVVAASVEEAKNAVDMMLGDGAFGAAGSRVVIEEFMVGEEASLLAFTDGYTIVPMVAAQDHKRIYDNDLGPNTGGMGAYAPAPVVTEKVIGRAVQDILQPVVDALRQEGCLYRGCLYAGLMITADGPKVVEFNARFGDPETQVIMPLLESDLAEIMLACADGNLHAVDIKWRQSAAACVVLAAGGYPGSYGKGDIITGLDEAGRTAQIFHAGTAKAAENIVTSGGRVLAVTAVGNDIAEAVRKAYEAVRPIQFTGCHYRTDIAHRALTR